MLTTNFVHWTLVLLLIVLNFPNSKQAPVLGTQTGSDWDQDEAKNCQMTECMASSPSTDLCSTLITSVNSSSKKLEYEEIFRKSCAPNKTTEVSSFSAFCCTKNSLDGKALDTLDAELNEFPHMAKMRHPVHCGGTIYNHRYIITAAHCLTNLDTGEMWDPEDVEIVLGSNSRMVEGPEYVYHVTKLIPHPKYSYLKNNSVWVVQTENETIGAEEGEVVEAERNDSRHFYDIGLFELNRNISFGENVKVLQIVSKEYRPLKYAKKALMAGWGMTEHFNLSIHLQKANFIIHSDKKCFDDNEEDEIYGPHWNFNELQDQVFCMGGVLEDKWSPVAREGDSGGPAVCRDKDGRAVLCGVTSFGGIDELCIEHNNEEHCGPSGYAAISYFNEWLLQHAGPQPKYDPNIYFEGYLYGKVVGGKGEGEHQVHITSSTSGVFCGGTLIAKDVVVTAAHCVWDLKDGGMHKGLRVTYGIVDLVNGNGQSFRVKGEPRILGGFGKYVFPVDVKSQGNRVILADSFYKNDLAVIKLEGEAPIAPQNIIGLPKQGDVFKEGTEYAWPTGIHPTIHGGTMVTRNFTILDGITCQKRLDVLKSANLILKVGNKLICGVEKYSGGSTCDRELGGGLICKGKNGKDVLCGVQVFRLCEWTIPNAFINVAEVSSFIREASL